MLIYKMFKDNEKNHWTDYLSAAGASGDDAYKMYRMHKSFIFYILQLKDAGRDGPFIVFFDEGKYRNKFDTLDPWGHYYGKTNPAWLIDEATRIMAEEVERNRVNADFSPTVTVFKSFYDMWAEDKFGDNFYPACGSSSDSGSPWGVDIDQLQEAARGTFDLGFYETRDEGVICNFIFASPPYVTEYKKLLAARKEATAMEEEKTRSEKVARREQRETQLSKIDGNADRLNKMDLKMGDVEGRVRMLEENAGLSTSAIGGARMNKNKRKRKKRTRKKRTRKKRTRKKRTMKKRTRKRK